MPRSRTLACTGLAALCLVAAPGSVRAQGPFLEGSGGVVAATGDLGQIESSGSSPVLALGAGYAFGPRVALRAEAALINMSGKDLGGSSGVGPGARLLTLDAGVEVMTKRAGSPLHASLSAGIGAAKVDFEGFSSEAQPGRYFEVGGTYPMVSAGVRAGYDLGRFLGVFVRGGASYVLFDRDDTAPLGTAGPRSTSVGPSVIFPLTLGLRVSFARR